MTEPTIVVHGGCGNIASGRIRDEPDFHAALTEALMAGSAALTAGAGALGAAQAAVARLEDAPIFNAGRGSVLTADGRVEMDAALACGRTRRAGAVAAVTTVRHPIALAREVMEATPHVMLVGDGAERLAAERGLERMDPAWFVTERRRRALAAEEDEEAEQDGSSPLGTVGAVVLDADGALAAATSSGGVTGKLPGRVGDSPILGAGSYADHGVAVSMTGNGEAILRAGAAHELSALMRHAGLGLAAAAEQVVRDRVGALGGEVGLIAIDAEGNIAMPFDTTLMHRGWRAGDGEPHTAVFA
jgi:isoaspartyl peptidase/L-asparaginase-like protein (Ntn-hydrolase superfamily)